MGLIGAGIWGFFEGFWVFFVPGCLCRVMLFILFFLKLWIWLGFGGELGIVFSLGCSVSWGCGTHEFLQSDVLDEFVHQVASAAVLHTVTPQIQFRQGPVQLSDKVSSVIYLSQTWFNCQRKVSTVKYLFNCQRKVSTVKYLFNCQKKCQLSEIISNVRTKWKLTIKSDSGIGNY